MRTEGFSDRENGRYWWFKQVRPSYDPPVFAMMSDGEWDIVNDWYEDSERHYGNGTGECAVPAISFLHGLLMGNATRRVVQLGHFIGFSTLMLGFTLRQMGMKNSLYSIDIDPDATRYSQTWLDRAQLGDYVRLAVTDSSSPDAVSDASDYLGGPPQLIFIDSSHQYQHTLAELDLWYPALQPGGLILLHDVSQYAATFDYDNKGGVAKAVTDWLRTSDAECIRLNGNLTNQGGDLLTYRDGCGLGVMQKPLAA